ncbi:MAG: class I SAM-dependent methyltransferase [Bacteroidota bacterium]
MEEQLYRKFFEVETTHWWFTARQRIVSDVIEQNVTLAPNAKILDVGCGTGAILAMFQKKFEAYGTDTSALAIEFCHQRGLANTFCCTLDTFPHPELRFDLITLLDVIEHIDSDSDVLRQAYTISKPDGHILVTVPAYQFLWSRHDDLNHHKRRYSKSQLKSVLEASGFTLEKLSYYNSLLFPTALVSRMAARIVKPKTDTTLDLPPRFINSLLGSIFGFERFLLRGIRLPFGLSLIALAKKGNA